MKSVPETEFIGILAGELIVNIKKYKRKYQNGMTNDLSSLDCILL